jgi:hypothetical protein
MFHTFPYLYLLGDYDKDVFMITCDSDYYEALGKLVPGKVTEVRFVTYPDDSTVSSDTVLVLGKIDGIWYPVCSYWADEIALTEHELIGKTPREINEYYWTIGLGHGMNDSLEQLHIHIDTVS